ncbi:MAG TPA: tripartite tricarboxylate transporter substrate binding protein [Pseudolabrys sp.]|nr:tripartite tricarboxylate transporter substrate binding protein [Pseudolabrys sp.]
MRRRDFLASGTAAAAWPLLAKAQPAATDFPTRPITLIVPYAAGGGNDAMARAVADHMGHTLGQAVVVENRGGAGGTIATRQLAKSPADGYTLCIGGTGTLAIGPTLYGHVGYDPRKDFAPIGLIASGPLIVLVHPSLPAKNIQELIARAKAQPGKLNYASAGSGSGIHLGTVLFAEAAGIDITHIPYKGTGPALTDLLGGHVAIYLSSLPPAIGLVRAGSVRALGVTGLKRSSAFPDVPTVAEQGLPGFEAVLHYGIVAPAGTPRPIVDKLNVALREALASADVQARLANEGAEALPTTPDEYAADIDREETKWSAAVKKSGAKVE